MCGRYKISTKAAEIIAAFDVDAVEDADLLRPRYNAAPTDLLPVIRVVDHKRVLRPLRWGLIPFWAKDETIGSRMINARSESAFEKPAFRDALENRRCLVVTDGFYEWRREGKVKQPYLFQLEDGHPFAFAGLWARWKGSAGPIDTFTVLTQDANEVVAPFHDRMPVILDPADHQAWLDPEHKGVDLESLTHPRHIPNLTAIPVSQRVNRVDNDDPAVAEAAVVSPEPVQEKTTARTTAKKSPTTAAATGPRKKPGAQGSLF